MFDVPRNDQKERKNPPRVWRARRVQQEAFFTVRAFDFQFSVHKFIWRGHAPAVLVIPCPSRRVSPRDLLSKGDNVANVERTACFKHVRAPEKQNTRASVTAPLPSREGHEQVKVHRVRLSSLDRSCPGPSIPDEASTERLMAAPLHLSKATSSPPMPRPSIDGSR